MDLFSCSDNSYLSSFAWFQSGEYRNAFSSLISGILFFLGWWFIIDANVTHPDDFKGTYHLCGIFATLAFIIINNVPMSALRGNGLDSSETTPKILLFFGFAMGFGTVIAACWILLDVLHYQDHGNRPTPTWVGCALVLQNTFIIIGSLIYKFGRVDDQCIDIPPPRCDWMFMQHKHKCFLEKQLYILRLRREIVSETEKGDRKEE